MQHERASCRTWLRPLDHRVPQDTDLLDLQFQLITGRDSARRFRTSRGYDVSGVQNDVAADELHELCDAEVESAGVGGDAHFTVHPQRHIERGLQADLVDGDEPWSHGREGLEALAAEQWIAFADLARLEFLGA